jgi:UDP-sugar pyrophosphorylase
MTSDDTHNPTVELLEKNNYFGLKKSQFFIIKQDKVPSFIDNNANFSILKDQLLIETKPHGHGDVHKLLHVHGIAKKWGEMGKKWIITFQDTIALSFKAVPSALGVSLTYDYDINTVGIPRKPGEAIGSMTSLTNTKTNETTNIHIEYNQLGPLLEKTWNKGGDVPDENGNSYFPGNAGTLVFKLSSYLNILEKSEGNIPEFVNPKYKEDSRDEFKKATRLECIVPMISMLYGPSYKVGFSMYERWFPFSAVKNNYSEAVKRFQLGLHPECGVTGEYDIFENNSNILKMSGAIIDEPTESDVKNFHGIKIKDGAKIFIHPSFGVTLKEIKSKISGILKISKRSILWLEGENTRIQDLVLDSTLITNEESNTVKGTYIDQKYIDFEPLPSFPTENSCGFDEIHKIKGFSLKMKKYYKELEKIIK